MPAPPGVSRFPSSSQLFSVPPGFFSSGVRSPQRSSGKIIGSSIPAPPGSARLLAAPPGSLCSSRLVAGSPDPSTQLRKR
eukprot:5710601-Alexandrium_andersonii.AAC.1